jgi:hypothetical protein
MKTTKKKTKVKRKAKRPVDPANSKQVNAALDKADYRIDQIACGMATEKAVLFTLEHFIRCHRVQLTKFIIENSACDDPVEIAYRCLVICKWLELKTRDYAPPKTP